MKYELLLAGLTITALLAIPFGKYISKIYADKHTISDSLFI